MGEERKRASAAFWATVALVVLLVGYPLSIGPACWVSSHLGCGSSAASLIYGPAIRACGHGPNFVAKSVAWYSVAGAAEGWNWKSGLWLQSGDSEFWVVEPSE
jgi:hypothetical protein